MEHSTTFAELPGRHQKVLLGCTINKVKSIALMFDGTELREWKNVRECMKLGLVEMFIGKVKRIDDWEACPRLRLTTKGRKLYEETLI
jgi:hypothetical protein